MNYETSGIAPFSQDAEEAVLGSVFINPDAYFNLASFLRPEDFYILRHAYIWEAMMRVAERSEVIDLITVREELRASNRLNDVGGPGYLTQLTVNVPTSVHAEVYGRLVERAAVRRRLLTAADEIRALAMDETLSLDKVTGDAETRLFRVTERNLRRDMVPMREAISDYFERVEHLMHNPDEPLGLPTGFRDLDGLLGGLQRSDLLIFAGRPGMGKCVTGNTLIPTEHGLLPIAALKPENSPEGFTPLRIGVQTPDGVRYTSHFYDSGIQPTLRITTRGGRQLEATLNHPVLKITRGDQPVWTPLDQLALGDHVAISATNPHALTDSPTITHDEVIDISVNGLQHCYDLTLPDNHSFISNGIVSHNTSFLLSVALNAAKLGARILIFTMEMGNEQIVQRFLSMETGINTQKLRIGQLNQQEWTRFVQATGRLGNLRIYIDDSPAQTPLQMRTKCRRLAHEVGLDLVIVDYLQLMTAGAGYENNRVQEISYISRNLKELAREINVPVFSAAQLSRAVESRQDKRPMLSDLRESGCLSGDTLIYLPRTGEHLPIRDLMGKTGVEVLSLNTDTWKLEPAAVTNAFCTGTKPVYKLTTRLGREIRATGNHKFLTISGWKRLDELTPDDHIALPTSDTKITPVGAHRDAPAASATHLVGTGLTLSAVPAEHTTPVVGTQEKLVSPVASATATTDVYWDEILSIQPDGETDVYDLTVPPYANFVADNIIVHNSIEQDSDVVVFLYRDAVYNEATEFPSLAELIVAKHRNGPTGTINLHFEKSLTKFSDARTQSIDLSSL